MIEKLAGKLAKNLHHYAEEPLISISVLKYGLTIVINTIFVVSLSLTLGGLTGKLLETAIGIGCFLILRACSGGHHLNTSTACILLSTLISVTIPHVSLHEISIIMISLISIALFMIYSPSNLQRQSRIPSRYYPLLKVISTALAVGGLLLGMEVITVSIFIQALSLIRFKLGRG